MRDAYILAGLRSPLGSYGGSLGSVPAVNLAGTVAGELLRRSGVRPAEVEEIILGNVLGAGLGQNPARQAGAIAGIPFSSSAFTVDMVCGSGLWSVCLAAQGILLGKRSAVIAGGTENMSRAPKILLQARKPRKIVSSLKYDGLRCAFNDEPMGMAAEWLAREYDVSREEQDIYAYDCYRKARASISERTFSPEIVSIRLEAVGETAGNDECRYCDSSLEELSRLRPAFVKDGTVTAGNATPIADGAAVVLVGSAEFAADRGLVPMARIAGCETAGVEPRKVHTSTIIAVRKLLDSHGLSTGDVDVWELNDSFAVQGVVCLRELGLDPSRVNIRGGTLALGHPLGASGARILVTLLHILKDRGARRGIAAICLGGGNAVAMLIENIE